MTSRIESGADDRIVVGYFSDGTDAFKAINELIDEGFRASVIGAAFRTRRTGAERSDRAVGDMERVAENTERNPAVTGSMGGAGSHDQAVTPAGLAPGAGAAFPGASAPGPIPGGEIPQTLPHDLPETLPHDLPSTLHPETPVSATAATAYPATSTVQEERGQTEGRTGEGWMDRLRKIFGSQDVSEKGNGPKLATGSSLKFGAGEGHLGVYPAFEYSETAFEGSFLGMGLGTTEARSLSTQLSRGGAVITIRASDRSSLAEAILERNHGHIRFETAAVAFADSDRETPVEVYGSMRSYYQPDESLRHRRAS